MGLNVKRLLAPRYSWGVFGAMLVVTLHVAVVLTRDARYLDGVRVDQTAILAWIGFGANITSTQIFYYLLPVFAALGPGRAIIEDFTSGFARHLVQHHPGRYLAQNIGISCLVGLVTAVGALIVDLLFSMLLLPNLQPDAVLDYGFSVSADYTYFTHLFFSGHALLVIGFYIILAGVITAGFTLFEMLVGLITLNMYGAMVAPMVGGLLLTVGATSMPHLVVSPVAAMIGDSPNPVPQLTSLLLGLACSYVLLIGGIIGAFWWRTTK